MIEETKHAMILAAGFGSRLKADEGHKLLAKLGGRTLLDWHLDNFRALDVTHLTIVTGYRHEALEAAVLKACQTLPMQVTTAYNPKFEGSNGLSVLTGVHHARALWPETNMPFWLTMADHIFDPDMFKTMSSWPNLKQQNIQGALFVDYKLEDIYDMPDATKVCLNAQGQLSNINKALTDFQAVDVGLFWCHEGFVRMLEIALDAHGDCSTSDAVKGLCAHEQFAFLDIGPYLWQDVDTPGARAHAEKILKAW